ncbi:MAG: hypothetical protein JHC95_09135 [Solirubrobacteraceae bacterium]|nr:hypothetical protein [Solirubrobacteraceae bacterium]
MSHRTLRRLRAVVVAAAALAGPALPATAPAAPSVFPPTPAADPFYASPDGFASSPPGTVLRSRRVAALAYGAPVALAGASAWQVLFRSTGTRDEPITAVTTVLTPAKAFGRRGALISHQTATDAIAPKCRPSYALRTGTEYEAGLIALQLARGFTVSVPDYEGPRDAWGAGRIAGNITLDGARAALAFPQAGLPGPTTPVGLMGYSGGGLASGWAAERQPSYAPDLNLKGAAVGGVPADLGLVLRGADRGFFSSVPIIAAAGVSREFPEVGLEDWLTERGKGVMRRAAEMCREQLVRWPFQDLAKLSTKGHPLELPNVTGVIAENSLGQVVPTTPIYNYHSRIDQLAPVRGADGLVDFYCRNGGVVQKVRSALGEHVIYDITGAPGAIDFLSRVLAGGQARNTCPPG